MIENMFPMLGPPRNKNSPRKENIKEKKHSQDQNQNQKTVRLIDPKQQQQQQQPSTSSSFIGSNETIRSRDNIPSAIPQPLEKIPSIPSQVPPTSSQLSRHASPSSSINPPLIFPRTLIVISFITRRPLEENQGQGSELLFYKPKSFGLYPTDSRVSASCISKFGCQKYGDKSESKWTFLFIDGETIEGGEDEMQTQINKLSIRSIRRHLTPPDDRLIHVRSSKPLRWDSDTVLVSVLYLLKHINRKTDQDWIKINVHSHYWSKINGFHTAVENDLVSTALAAVCFPVAFNVGFEEIARQDFHTRSDLVTIKALDTLYLSVQAGYARDGFMFYPKSVEPLKKSGNSDRDFKRRIWAYWTEVLFWHLIVCRSIFKVSISYALHKIMVELKPAVEDDKVNVEDLEKMMVSVIGKEADRCRQSIDNIVNHTIFEILHNPLLSPSLESSNLVHLFTLGSSSATYGALSQLVQHFATRSRWKSNSRGETEKTGLKITIGESRPLHEGVILAQKLNELVKVYDPPQPTGGVKEGVGEGGRGEGEESGKTRLKRFESLGDFGYHDSNDWYLDSKHQKVTEKFDNPVHLPPLYSNPPQPNQDGTPSRLDDLLQQYDQSRQNQGLFNFQEAAKIKVMIEITSDVGLRSSLLNAGHTGILLLSADRVLPNGDALCRLGSSSAARTAHMMNQIVIILVRHDRIEPATELESTTSSSSEEEEVTQSGSKKKRRKQKSLLETQECRDDQRHRNDGCHPLIISSLILSWKSMFKPDIVDLVSKKTLVGGNETNPNLFSGHVSNCSNLGFDRVKADWISFFVTDSGAIGLERVKEVSKTLTALTRLLWEEEEQDFM